jgi:hypothetical protein
MCNCGWSSGKFLVMFAVAFITVLGCDKEEFVPSPLIEILSPEPNSTISEAFNVNVSAFASDGINRVELYLNNVMVGKAEVEPFNFTVNVIGYDAGTYTIKAVAYSNSERFTAQEMSITLAKPTFIKPLEFKASKGSFGYKIVLTWNKVPGATSYEVYKQGPTQQFAKVTTVTDETFEDSDITEPLTKYFYKVRAYNSETSYGEFSDPDYGYSSAKPYDLIRSFGTEGTALDQFGMIVHISYHNNELYVADDRNQRVVKYTNDGNFAGLFQSYSGYPIAPYFFEGKLLNTYNNIIDIQTGATVNKSITTDLIGIRQVTVDDENHIYATASNSQLIAKYDINGNELLKWGVNGNLPGQVDAPWGIVFYNDNIVVSNYYSNKVQFFTKTGGFIKEWSFDGQCHDLYVKDGFLYIACGSYVAKTDYEGLVIEKIYGDFTLASSIAIDDNNNIFITDPYQRKIYVYKKSK